MYLLGPQSVSLRDGVGIIARAVGKEVNIVQVGKEEGVEVFVEAGVPRPVASYLIGAFDKMKSAPHNGADEQNAEARANVQRYTGKPATTLEEWAEENKHEFTA